MATRPESDTNMQAQLGDSDIDSIMLTVVLLGV
jgi:hypothetical protein